MGVAYRSNVMAGNSWLVVLRQRDISNVILVNGARFYIGAGGVSVVKLEANLSKNKRKIEGDRV